MEISEEEIKARSGLYEKFGWTSESGQLLETELITCALALEGIRNKWYLMPEPNTEGSTHLKKLDDATLGKLIKELRKQLDIDETELGLLSEALEARNRLHHGFFLKHGKKIQTEVGREQMLADLEEIHTTLFEAWQLASHLTEILCTSIKLLQEVHLPKDDH